MTIKKKSISFRFSYMVVYKFGKTSLAKLSYDCADDKPFNFPKDFSNN